MTDVDALTLARVPRLELLESALHAPQAGFGYEDFYPGLVDMAAVLAVRLVRNHPLPDGQKAFGPAGLTMFWRYQRPRVVGACGRRDRDHAEGRRR